MYSNYNFKKGLEKQMKLKGVTSSKKLSELTGYPASTISNYRNEKANPTLHVLVDFADYFEVSIDELILRGRGEEMSR